MSDAEHLIENVIFALKRDEDIDNELGSWNNRHMLENSGISKEDIKAMATHVVYSLYNGDFPKLLDECVYCRGYDREMIFNNRDLSMNNEDFYTGFHAYISENDDNLVLYSCIDTPGIKAVSSECRFKINYCPMCGRKL